MKEKLKRGFRSLLKDRETRLFWVAVVSFGSFGKERRAYPQQFSFVAPASVDRGSHQIEYCIVPAQFLFLHH